MAVATTCHCRKKTASKNRKEERHTCHFLYHSFCCELVFQQERNFSSPAEYLRSIERSGSFSFFAFYKGHDEEPSSY